MTVTRKTLTLLMSLVAMLVLALGLTAFGQGTQIASAAEQMAGNGSNAGSCVSVFKNHLKWLEATPKQNRYRQLTFTLTMNDAENTTYTEGTLTAHNTLIGKTIGGKGALYTNTYRYNYLDDPSKMNLPFNPNATSVESITLLPSNGTVMLYNVTNSTATNTFTATCDGDLIYGIVDLPNSGSQMEVLTVTREEVEVP